MYALGMNDEGKSTYKEVNKDMPLPNKRELEVLMDGPFEVKELLSGDFLLVNIENQVRKVKAINSIATSLIQQKVYGPCMLLDPKEAAYANLTNQAVI